MILINVRLDRLQVDSNTTKTDVTRRIFSRDFVTRLRDCVESRSEDLSYYLNDIQSVGLWKNSYDYQLADKAYYIDITMKNIYKSFTHKMAAKASWH